jgi:hypothetical protein
MATMAVIDKNRGMAYLSVGLNVLVKIMPPADLTSKVRQPRGGAGGIAEWPAMLKIPTTSNALIGL